MTEDRDKKLDHKAYKYEPKWDILIDRHPDRRPSLERIEEDKLITGNIFVEVKGLGAIVVNPHGDVSLVISYEAWEKLEWNVLSVDAGVQPMSQVDSTQTACVVITPPKK